jgi:hypothetical protein
VHELFHSVSQLVGNRSPQRSIEIKDSARNTIKG